MKRTPPWWQLPGPCHRGLLSQSTTQNSCATSAQSSTVKVALLSHYVRITALQQGTVRSVDQDRRAVAAQSSIRKAALRITSSRAQRYRRCCYASAGARWDVMVEMMVEQGSLAKRRTMDEVLKDACWQCIALICTIYERLMGFKPGHSEAAPSQYC